MQLNILYSDLIGATTVTVPDMSDYEFIIVSVYGNTEYVGSCIIPVYAAINGKKHFYCGVTGANHWITYNSNTSISHSVQNILYVAGIK